MLSSQILLSDSIVQVSPMVSDVGAREKHLPPEHKIMRAALHGDKLPMPPGTGSASSVSLTAGWRRLSSMGDRVVHPSSCEEFMISRYPASREIYWKGICEEAIDVGVQLEDREGKSYHINEKEPLYLPSGSTIELISSKYVTDEFIERCYRIQERGKPARIFYHFALAWLDFDLPARESFLTLHEQYAKHVIRGTKVHVHCGAGQGRSGTFVLSRVLLQAEEKIPVDGVLALLRSQRGGLVETPEQEEFAISCADFLRAQPGPK